MYGPGVNRVEVRRRIGMVFQKPNPFPKSIYDNVAWAPRNLGLRSDVSERVERALRQAALWDEVKDRLKKSALGLSGGQQQRLCIARAIAVEPDVLLLDEPASALDPVSTAAIEELILELKTRYTIVIVTHNMQQAARVGDRAAFFSLDRTENVGTLIEYDDVETIFRNPRTSARGNTSPVSSGRARATRLASREVDDIGREPGGALAIAARMRRPALRPRELRADRVAMNLLQQRLPALPAVHGADRVRCAARGALAGGRGLLEPQDPLDLAQLGVGGLELGRTADEHVDPDPVANRHLVDEPAEVPLELGDPGVELVPAPLEVNEIGAHSSARRTRRAELERASAPAVGSAARPGVISNRPAESLPRVLGERRHQLSRQEEVAGELVVLASGAAAARRPG